MISEKQYIAKGNYLHTQIGRFVSVKNYIFLRADGKKHLLLRFSNDMDYTADGFDYTVFAYDADGAELSRERVSHSGLRVLPGETFSTPTPIAVDEKCVDFRVVFSEVRSGEYRYCVSGDTVSVRYERNGDGLFERNVPLYGARPVEEYDAYPRSFGDQRSAKLAATLLVLILLFLNVANMLFAYRVYMEKKEENASHGAQAAALNLDGEFYVEI